MLPRDLNRDIKRLGKKANELQENKKVVSEEDRTALEKEWFRLFRADRTFEYMTKKSILIMLSLNLRHRFRTLHQVGSALELKKVLDS